MRNSRFTLVTTSTDKTPGYAKLSTDEILFGREMVWDAKTEPKFVTEMVSAGVKDA